MTSRPHDPTHSDRELNLLEYWQILVERKAVVLACVGAVCLLGVVLTFLATPQYQAATTLQIERHAPDILTFKDVIGTDTGIAAYQDFYHTQYRILRSNTVLRLASQRLDLSNRPEFVSREGSPLRRMIGWAKSLVAGSEPVEAVDPLAPSVRFLAVGIGVVPIRNSHLVEVRFTDRDPKLARDVANAVAAAYQQFNLESRYNTTEQASEFLTKEVARLESEIAELERRLQEYGEAREILALSDGTQDISEQALGDLNRRYVDAKGRLAVAETRYHAIRDADPESLREVLSSPLINHLKQEYAEAERRHTQMSERFKSGWPELEEASRELAQLELRMKIETENIAQQAAELALANYEQAQAEVAHLRQQVEEQKREVQRVSLDAIDYAGLKAQIDTRREVLSDLVARQSETETSGQLRGTGASNVRVVDAAEVPEAPIRPRKVLNVLLSLVLGALLGVCAAFLLHYLDNSVKTEQDLQRYAQDVPVLGHIPILESLTLIYGRESGPKPDETAPKPNADLASHQAPRSTFSEAFKSLRTSLLLASPDHPPRRIVVTSCEPGDGKTTVAINLGIVLTQMGRRVLLIDADLRRPSIYKALGLPKSVGLSSALSGNASPEEIVVDTEVPNLRVVTSGPIPPNPSELLDSPGFETLIERLAQIEGFDHVVIDTPPALHMADSVILGTKADATILVVRSAETSRESLLQGVGRLRQARIKLTGAVLNAVSERRGYYYYRYRDYHGETAERGVGTARIASKKRRARRWA